MDETTLVRGRGRLGVIVPSSNVNLEPDVYLLVPPGVTAHFARVGSYDPGAVPDPDEMRAFAVDDDLDEAVRTLAAADIGVVAYGCTSATLSHDPAFDGCLTERISAVAGVPAVTAAGALVEALRRLGVARVGLASPYVEELNREAAAFLEASGFEVVASACPPERLTSKGQRDLRPSDAYELGRRADGPSAEAVVISCTDFRAVEAIEALEEALDKPVVTSNQALVHQSLLHLGVEPREGARGGRLFRLPVHAPVK